MKIILLNAKYSSNLGDGAIAECLEYQISKHIPDATIFSLDISGSYDYGGSNSMVDTSIAKNIFNNIPKSIQKTIKYLLRPIMVKQIFSKKWRSLLQGADAIIIGGGQLFMDVDRYFPTRLLIAINSSRKGTPVFIYSVGVSKTFTPTGKKYFNKLLNHGTLINISVRDMDSKNKWLQNFDNTKIQTTLDPALLALDTYKESQVDKSSRDRKLVALGIADPSSMTAHSDNHHNIIGNNINFFLKTIELLILDNFKVALFTNGGDQDYLDQVVIAMESLDSNIKKHVTIMPRALKPVELVRQIEQADVVVAHRLHANILAYSYKIPSVGLMWDKKVESFFDITHRRDYLITDNIPEQVVDKVKKSLKHGLDKELHKKITSDAAKDIYNLSNQILGLKND